MRALVAMFFLMCGLHAAYAQRSASADAPITYQKERLILKPSTGNETTLQSSALFYVDVKKADASINQDWFQLSGMQPNTGLLLTYEKPQIISIEPANMYAHYDMIAANAYGEIVLILPDIVLADLAQPIDTPEPAVALLYVAAGTAQALNLKIGDRIEHRMFANRPNIIDAITINPTPSDAASVSSAPEILPAGNNVEAEQNNGRRRPVGNPVIAQPTPPKAPEKPAAPTIIMPDTNTNLGQIKAADTPETKALPPNFLDQILKRELKPQSN